MSPRPTPDQDDSGPPPRASLPWPTPVPGAPGLPVVLSLAGARCLVVGGGRVGARRARELAGSGALVTVVAPEIDPTLTELAECRVRPYRPGEASTYHLVVAATGVAATDRGVVADALSAGVLVSSADGAHPGNVSLPAVHRDGAVTVAVSTSGASPALAVWLRSRIAGSLGPGVAALADLASEARETLRRTGAPAGSVDWDSAFDEVAPLVAAGRMDEARTLLLAHCAGDQRAVGEPGDAGDDSVGSAP
jgi:precorrin-2 dehydrogenase / sirohydrochlorin ferrochelatase